MFRNRQWPQSGKESGKNNEDWLGGMDKDRMHKRW